MRSPNKLFHPNRTSEAPVQIQIPLSIAPLSLKSKHQKLSQLASKQMTPRKIPPEMQLLEIKPVSKTPTHFHHKFANYSYPKDFLFDTINKTQLKPLVKNLTTAKPADSPRSELPITSILDSRFNYRGLDCINHINLVNINLNTGKNSRTKSSDMFGRSNQTRGVIRNTGGLFKDKANSKAPGTDLWDENLVSDVFLFNYRLNLFNTEDFIIGKIVGITYKNKIEYFLGNGRYGKSYKACNLKNNQNINVKVLYINFNIPAHMTDIQKLSSKLVIFKDFRSEFIVKYIDSEIINNVFYVYSEHFQSKNLLQSFKALGNVNKGTIKLYLIQILKGINALHARGIIHANLKIENILVDPSGHIKISDCIYSDFINRKVQDFNISNPFSPPELPTTIDKSTDIWLFGLLAFDLITYKAPKSIEINYTAFKKSIVIENTIPNFVVSVSTNAKNFLISCFNKDPKKRPSAKDLLGHIYLNKYNI
jgi:Protein kinase domain